MAYQTDIVQHDCSFCDENCRLWIFGYRQGFRLYIYTDCGPTCSLWAVVPKTCRTRQSVLHCYADRGAVFFTRHANSEVHQQKLWAESSNSTLPLGQLICVIICWTHLSHLRLFTGKLMAVLTSATWWPTTAHMSVLRQSSLMLKLCCYSVSKHSTFKRLFL